MSLRSFITNVFSSGVQAVSDAGVKTVTGSIKDLSGTAKDVTGIRRDVVETKLAELKLEDQQSRITIASLDDVKSYDPRFRRLERAARLPLFITVFSILTVGAMLYARRYEVAHEVMHALKEVTQAIKATMSR